VPPEHIQARDDRDAEEPCSEHTKHEDPIAKRLPRMERQPGALL